MNTKLIGHRVLVTGGAGYIGSHLCKRLSQLGAHPIVFDNFCRGFSSNVRWGPAHVGDVRESAQVLKALKCSEATMVVHLAGLTNARESVQEPELYASVNRDGTVGMLQALAEYVPVPLIYSSSCSVYGSAHGSISEDSPALPESPYGMSKLQGERAVKEWVKSHGRSAMILRYFNVAGADPEAMTIKDYNEGDRIISRFMKQALYDEELVLRIHGGNYETDDGTCVRDYIHVLDTVEAHIKALVSFDNHGPLSVFNVSSGKGFSNLEIAKAIQNMTGRSLKIEVGECRPGDPASAVGVSKKARQDLGWKPQHSELGQIIETLLMKFRESPIENKMESCQ